LNFNAKTDKVVCYNGTTPVDSAPALRIFFDGSSFSSNLKCRGWKVLGDRYEPFDAPA
jgi:hypothetical protein